MDGWNTTLLLGRPIFRGYVSLREGIYKSIYMYKTSNHSFPGAMLNVGGCIFLCSLFLVGSHSSPMNRSNSQHVTSFTISGAQCSASTRKLKRRPRKRGNISCFSGWTLEDNENHGSTPSMFRGMNQGQVFTHTVDGRNPAPPRMYITLWILGYLLHQLVQDFFHQQYYILAMNEWWLMHTMKNLFRQMDYLHQTRVKPIASLKTPSRCLVWYDSPCIYECCIAHILYELHTWQ